MCQKTCDNCKQGGSELVEVDYSEHAKAIASIIIEAKRMCGRHP